MNMWTCECATGYFCLCHIWSSQNTVVEYSKHLGFDVVLLGKRFLSFEGLWCLLLQGSVILLAFWPLKREAQQPFKSWGTTCWTVSHPWRHECSTISCCACRPQFSHLGNVDSARCEAPSSLAACLRSSGWPSSLYALFSASLVGHCTWRNDGTAWEQHFVSLLPWHQFQVKVLGIILIEGTLYLICNWSPGSSITRM